MNVWPNMTLGDLIHVKHGFAFKGEFFTSDGDKLVLKPGNFPVGGGIRLRPGKDDYYTGSYPPNFELSPGDLLVVMTDLTQAAPILGSPAFVPDEPVMLHNQRLGLVQIKEGVELDRRFLYYAMLSDTSRSQIRATATGATVRHTAPERIYRVRLGVPPLALQQVLGDVLGSLDDLIENNRRRVAVLEEMARAIYREWFVKFRYPGHEDVPLVDSTLGPIPEGWEVRPLAAIAKVNQSSRKPRPDEVFRYLDIAALAEREVGELDTVEGVDAPGRARRVLKPGDTVWATVRPNRRAHALVVAPGEDWIASTGLAVLSPTIVSSAFLFEATSTTTFSDWLIGRATGSAYPAVRAVDFEEATVAVPNASIDAAFAEKVAPMHELSWKLRAECSALAGLRDLLLPKLVTGQIDVSSLDLDALVEERVAS